MQVMQFAEPLCESEGLELVFTEYLKESRGRVLRVYIDKPGGVSLDDCTFVSRQLSDFLDVHFEDIGPYNLEVSSPGPNRPLGKPEDFEKFKGEMVNIRISRRQQKLMNIKKKNFRVVLLGIEGGIVRFAADDEIVEIPYAEIDRARLVNNNGE